VSIARSLLLALAAAAATFLAAAIALGILGIAQAGHGGNAWTDSPAISRDPVQLSLADALALAASLLAGAVAFIAAQRH
jgi:hypothetical protein